MLGEKRVQIIDLTKEVRDRVLGADIDEGIVFVNSRHTTCGLFINEFQGALIEDLKALAERLVPEQNGYRHNDSRVSDCERGNAHAHLRAALFGRSIAVGVRADGIVLGQFQSIIFAEFDGPRKREVMIQILGE